MSRCKACNKRLTEHELRRRLHYPNKQWEYADMCTPCLSLSDNSKYKIRDPKVINDEFEDVVED